MAQIGTGTSEILRYLIHREVYKDISF
ncbi:MAG: hypothetical protein ACFFD2_03735 [Promethearchaeota archaeon]